MVLPAKEVAPSELWLKLHETPRPSEIVDFPRPGIGKVRIQVLRMEEHRKAKLFAKERLRELKLTTEDQSTELMKDMVGDEVAKELLAMAIVSVDPIPGQDPSKPPVYVRYFRDGKDLDIFTADELSVLFNDYIVTQHKYGPYERTIDSDEELNAWIHRLVEGGSEFPLVQLALPQLVELTYSLAARTSTLSRILESLYSTLPATLQSSLASLGIGTGFYGAQLESSTASISSASSEAAEPAKPIEPINAAEALKRARDMRQQ